MGLASMFFNIVLHILYSIPMVLCVIHHKQTKKPVFTYVFMIFLAYSIENVIIFMTEGDVQFARFYDETFMSNPALRTIIFVAVLYFMYQMNCILIDDGKHNVLFILALIIITLFMLIMPIIMESSAFKVFIYYTPCQLFSFAVGLYGALRIRKMKDKYNKDVRIFYLMALIVTAVFSILIILEDVIVIFNFDNYGLHNIHITNRSYTENIMTILYVIIATKVFAKYLKSVFLEKDTINEDGEDQACEEEIICESAEPGNMIKSPKVEADVSKFYYFCKQYQLTSREQDILKLLIDNKNNVEIGEALYISSGTAKTHAHNIFAKIGVGRRQELIELYEGYRY